MADKAGSETAALDPRLGEVVAERYRLVGRIGRGGMGAIYEAEHVVTGKRFAVKMLRPGLGSVPENTKRFEREARAASLLAHPNIVSVIDFGELPDGALFLAMELVSGRSLGDVMADEAVAPARGLAIVRQILEALVHAHAAGVIHRDLKPDNVMVTDFGDERDVVKLVDFGIAKVVGDAEERVGGETLTQAGLAFGTPDYMAPEQALGGEVDARADLYAVGVLCHELLTGEPPFVSADKIAVLRMHVAVDPPTLDRARFAPELDRLVARALAKRREDRYPDAAAMLTALDAAAAAQESYVVPPLRARRRRAIAAAGAVGVAAVLVVWVAVHGRGPAVVAPPTLVPGPDPARATALAYRLLGEARALAGKDEAALAAYEQAIALGAKPDDALVTNVQAWATKARKPAIRARARELAGAAGVTVDLVASWTVDLEKDPSCRERRDAVQHLRALADKRAVPALRHAIGRRGGFLNLGNVNGCLDRDAAEAIEFLNALP
jgi:serine/threonine-protein kinase